MLLKIHNRHWIMTAVVDNLYFIIFYYFLIIWITWYEVVCVYAWVCLYCVYISYVHYMKVIVFLTSFCSWAKKTKNPVHPVPLWLSLGGIATIWQGVFRDWIPKKACDSSTTSLEGPCESRVAYTSWVDLQWAFEGHLKRCRVTHTCTRVILVKV